MVMQAASFCKLMTSLVQEVSSLKQSVAVLAEPRISNTAAQVLLNATGEDLYTSTSTRFTAMFDGGMRIPPS